MKLSKRLTSKSGLTVPKQLREELGYRPGMAIDMEVTRQGLLIRPHSAICRFCGRIEDVFTVSDINLCKACARAFVHEVKQYDVE